MYKNLLSYIDELARRDEVARIGAFVDPVLEMAEIADRMAKSPGGGKALLFENTGTAFPVAMNLMGSEQRMCAALGIKNYEEITARIDKLFMSALLPKQNLWDKLKLLPMLQQAAQWFPVVSDKRGACQEVVMEKPDLTKLPILKCWPHDGGRFITLPMVHTKDPATGLRNVGMYRMQVFSETTTGMHWHLHKTGAKHFRSFAQSVNGKRQTVNGSSPFSVNRSPLTVLRSAQQGVFPVAVALGGDPVYSFCAAAPMPENMDEYLLAGFLRNKKVKLVRCLTQPLEVPADADFVIEGYIDPAEAPVTEGPFGDHTGFYSLDDRYPLFHVTCLTHRRRAVYPATVVGIPPQEDAYLSQAIEKIFLAPLRMAVAPEIRDLHLPFEGVSHNIACVKIENSYPGQAVKTAHALWGAGQMMFNKIMIVVDGDVSLTDYAALRQTILANYRPEHDTYFSQGPLDILDHATRTPGFGGKICIDATRPGPPQGMYRRPIWASFLLTPSPSPKGEGSRHFLPLFQWERGPGDEDGRGEAGKFLFHFDEGVDTSDFRTCAWLLGNNIDAVRDCKVVNGQLVIDARSKVAETAAQAQAAGYPARWPNVVCAHRDTIQSVDAKWPTLGLGALISSPSLKYSALVRAEGAELVVNEKITNHSP